MSKIVKFTQSCSNGHLLESSLSFILSMDDVACEFACAVTMRSINGRERP